MADYENVMEHAEIFIKKFSVAKTRNQEKLESETIAATAVQELISLREHSSMRERKVTFRWSIFKVVK